MSKIKMQVFVVAKGRFAVGTVDSLAKYVVQMNGKKVTGVRGRRPMLTKGRFELAKNLPEEVKAALKEALA